MLQEEEEELVATTKGGEINDEHGRDGEQSGRWLLNGVGFGSSCKMKLKRLSFRGVTYMSY